MSPTERKSARELRKKHAAAIEEIRRILRQPSYPRDSIELAMHYTMSTSDPDKNIVAMNLNLNFDRYQELCRRMGRENADKLIETCKTTLKMVDY